MVGNPGFYFKIRNEVDQSDWQTYLPYWRRPVQRRHLQSSPLQWYRWFLMSLNPTLWYEAIKTKGRQIGLVMIPSTDDACKETDQLFVWEKGKYLNGILLFSVLRSICMGGFYWSPCPTDKPRKKSSVCRKRNVKLLLHFSLLACSLCLEMDRILNNQLQLEKFPRPLKRSLSRCTLLWFVSTREVT